MSSPAAAEIDGGRVRQQLGRLASRHRTIARPDLVAVVARASTAGTSAEVVEAVASRLVEAAGPPLSGDPVRTLVTAPDALLGPRVPESRWTAADVVRAIDRGSEALLAPFGHDASAVGRSGFGGGRRLRGWDGDRPLVAERSTVAPVAQELER